VPRAGREPGLDFVPSAGRADPYNPRPARMHPNLFEIPGLHFTVHTFGLMLAIGFLVGSWLLGRLAARYGDDPEKDPARYARSRSGC
jgi:hypothetical protein